MCQIIHTPRAILYILVMVIQHCTLAQTNEESTVNICLKYQLSKSRSDIAQTIVVSEQLLPINSADMAIRHDYGGIICAPEAFTTRLNNSCWRFLKPIMQRSDTYLLSLLKDYEPTLVTKDNILLNANSENSPCFYSAEIKCDGEDKPDGQIFLKTPINNATLLTPNYSFDSYFTSNFFHQNESIICSLSTKIYTLINCLEKKSKIHLEIISREAKTLFKPRPKWNESVLAFCENVGQSQSTSNPKLRILLKQILYGTSGGVTVVHLIITIFFEKALKYPRNMFICFAILLIIQFLILIIQDFEIRYMEVCLVLYCIQRFTELGMYFWVCLISFDLWDNLKSCSLLKPSLMNWNKTCQLVIYCCIATFVPLIIIAADLTTQHLTPVDSTFHYKNNIPSCIFWQYSSKYVYLLSPEAIILLINSAFFFLVVSTIRKLKLATKLIRSQTSVVNYFSIYWKLSFILGIYWVLAIAMDITNNEILHYVSIVVLSFLGLILFFCFSYKYLLNLCSKHK